MTLLRWMTAVCALTLVAGCGSDDDDETGSSGSGGTGGMGGAGTAGSGGDAVGGMGGSGGTGGSDAAATFCAQYESTCGFGDTGRHADMDACITAYGALSPARQSCVTTHVGLASSGAALHCPHATGEAPCN